MDNNLFRLEKIHAKEHKFDIFYSEEYIFKDMVDPMKRCANFIIGRKLNFKLMERRKKYISPISSFDFHLDNYQNLVLRFAMQKDIKNLNLAVNNCMDDNYVSDYLNKGYDALVLTDTSQKILWVSDGFKKMTGYSKKHALGQTPKFLQGKKTSKDKRKKIREDLATKYTFTGDLINYRKNGETYICNINIVPIFSKKDELKYFLAIEKEVKQSA